MIQLMPISKTARSTYTRARPQAQRLTGRCTSGLIGRQMTKEEDTMASADLLAMEACSLLKEAYELSNESIPNEEKLGEAYTKARQALDAQERANLARWDAVS